MRPAALREAARGSVLAAIVFVITFSSIPMPVQAATSPGYFFTMTFLVPTTSPFRQQQAALIAENLRQINIDVRLVYVTFGVMAGRTFGCDVNNCGKTYDQGGFDAGIISQGGSGLIPAYGDQTLVSYRSLGSSDYPPTGANFIFYHNDTYNQLAAQYNTDYNATDRALLLRKMVAVVLQDRPDMPLFEFSDVYVIANYINQWGTHVQESSATANRDFQHWSVSQGDSINVAITENITSVNQWVDAVANTYFDAYLYNPTTAPLEEIDGRTQQYTKALATTITGSPDHLGWTVRFRPHTFQDGVPVTSDDYLFSMMGSLINDVGAIQIGTVQSILGAYGKNLCNCSGIQFRYLNGTYDYVEGGNYSHRVAPVGFTPTSTWTAVNDSAFTFTLSNAYLFTDPVLTSFSAAPMHIFEALPFAQWKSSPFATLHDTPYTFTYNHPGQANHGGNGSGTAYGPIGDGPYYYHGYNATAGVGTLVKWDGYWNRTGLESLGLFNAKTIHIMQIPSGQGIAAFQSGRVNFLDSSYAIFSSDQIAAIEGANGHLTHQSSLASGFRLFFLQLNHPVWGTGTATPNGKLDPTHANVYARYVRAAISHAIPRQEITDTFYNGLFNPGITEFCTCLTEAYPPGVQPDSFDLGLARSLLALAGYSTPGRVVALPIAKPVSNCVTGNSTRIAETLPSFIEGNTLTLSGTFGIPISIGNGTGGFYTTLEESTDNGTSWHPVTLTISTAGGYYSVSYAPSIAGHVLYRTFFTGIPSTSSLGSTGPNTPGAVESYVPPQTQVTGEHSANITDGRYSAVTALDIESLSAAVQGIFNAIAANDTAAIHSAICGWATSVNQSLSNFNSSTIAKMRALSNSTASKADLQNAADSLNARLTNFSYLAVSGLVATLIIGLSAIFLSRRTAQPSTRVGTQSSSNGNDSETAER